jgi:hypothetical protein
MYYGAPMRTKGAPYVLKLVVQRPSMAGLTGPITSNYKFLRTSVP